MQLTLVIVNAQSTVRHIISPLLPPRYSSKPNKFAWKRPFPRSQQRQGFVHGREAGSLQPCRQLRGGRLGSEAEPLPSGGESCAFLRGQREQLAQQQDLGRQRQCRPWQGAACPPRCPDPFWEGETETGKCWRALAGAG